MTETYTHKKGDSLDLVVTIPARFADGYFVGHEVTSQVRTMADIKVADLTCAWLDAVTTRSMRLSCLDTTAWPAGPAKFDVQFKRASDGFVLSSTTATIHILADVTRYDV